MHKKKIIIWYAFMIALVTLFGVTAAEAQLSELFNALFGGRHRAPPPASRVAPAPLHAAPARLTITITPRRPLAIIPGRAAAVGGTVAYCVRLCDGMYFPLPRLGHSRAAPVKSCRALCPGTRTKIFWGSQIEHAVTAGGGPYSRLDTAFKFRRELVRSCSCNGRDVFGTADIDIMADITLRRGDIVVTENGLRVFVGPPSDEHQHNAFTPIENFAGLPISMRRRLDNILVASAPQPAPKDSTFGAQLMFGVEALEKQIVPLNVLPARR